MPRDNKSVEAPPRSRPRRTLRANQGRGGFILVVVIWSLGLITILASIGIVGARFRGRATADIEAEATALAAADSGISLGILQASRQAPNIGWTAPLRCLLPGNQHLTVAIADEVGKVDLNMAPRTLLTVLFSSLTHDDVQGAHIAADIIAFREPVRDSVDDESMRRYRADEKPEGAKRAPFVTSLELDQVVGISPALFRAALPFVTVRAKRSDVDFSRATPAMRQLFRVGEVKAVPALPEGGREVTIRSDATTSTGARSVWEVLASIRSDVGGVSYVIHEWRRADVEARGVDRDGDEVEMEKPCFVDTLPLETWSSRF